MPTKSSASVSNDLLDLLDFLGARDGYRSCFLDSEPTPGLLHNLSIAEEYECVEYRTRLCVKYPDSFACLFALIGAAEKSGQLNLAMQVCSDAIASSNWLPNQVLSIRMVRIRLAVICEVAEIISIDFEEIWNANIDIEAKLRLRQAVLKTVAKATGSSLSPTIRTVASSLAHFILVADFLKHKANEIELLDIAIKSQRSGLDGSV